MCEVARESLRTAARAVYARRDADPTSRTCCMRISWSRVRHSSPRAARPPHASRNRVRNRKSVTVTEVRDWDAPSRHTRRASQCRAVLTHAPHVSGRSVLTRPIDVSGQGRLDTGCGRLKSIFASWCKKSNLRLSYLLTRLLHISTRVSDDAQNCVETLFLLSRRGVHVAAEEGPARERRRQSARARLGSRMVGWAVPTDDVIGLSREY